MSNHDPTVASGSGDETRDATSAGVGPPRRIDKYRIGQKIGAGGMGDIYRAEHVETEKVVAIKLIKPGVLSPEAIDRFVREYRLLGKLDHPNIATVFDAGFYEAGEETLPYYVMAYVAGAKPITEFAVAGGLSLEQRLRLFLQLCDAVEHANERRGIIHRDIKPSNVLVDAEGHVRLIDFGVATDTGGSNLYGEIVGTPSYMAPEMFDGDPVAIDQRSDVYTLGVVLYELLTGTLPYDLAGKANYEKQRIICTTPPDPLSKHDPSLPAELSQVVATALHKSRTNRFQRVAEFRGAIATFLRDSEVIETGTRFIAPRAPQTWRERIGDQYVAALAVVVLFATFLGVSGISSFWYRWTDLHFMYDVALFQSAPTTPILPQNNFVRGFVPKYAVEMVTTANAHGIEGITLDDVQSWRMMQAEAIDRLVDANVKVIVCDITFRGERPEYDGELADSMKRARDNGIPVIVGSEAWDWIEDPDYAWIEPIREHALIGGVTGTLENDSPWSTDSLVIDPELGELPSISLLAFAAYRQPQAVPRFRFDPNSATVTIRYQERLANGAAGARPIDTPELLGLSMADQERETDTKYRIRRNSFIGHQGIVVPDDDVLNELISDYETLFGMSREERRLELAGKVVVLAMPPPYDELAQYTDGRWVPKMVCHVVAIRDLLSNKTIRHSKPSDNFATVPLVACLAIGLIWRIPRRIILRVTAYAGLTLILVVASFGLYRASAYVLSPLILASVAVVAGELGAFVIRQRPTMGWGTPSS
ncbi:MAG: bifunctional serine/threonine-protein kinase/ABC transporter substrate-binding protein [Planctomycetota bacterium]